MATQAQLLQTLADAQSPMRQAEIGEVLKLKVSNFSGQLRGLEKQKFVSVDGEGAFVITDAGRDELQRLLSQYAPGEDLPSEEEAGTTEYQHFIRLGKQTGVMPDTLITLVANHVWTGDYRDIVWVAKAMQEMTVRNDLAIRWVNAWRGYLHQPFSVEAQKVLKTGNNGDKEAGAEEDKGGRDYILSPDDTPVFVGEGLGDMTHDDAFKLANTRAAAKGRAPAAAAAAAAESPLDTLSKAIDIAKKLEGDKTGAKTFIIKPGANGYEAEEMEAGKPLILPALGAAGGEKAPIYFFDRETQTLKELKPGEPIVLGGENKPAVGKNYYVDAAGNISEIVPGMPIVIKQAAPAAAGTPIQLRDSQGNPYVMDIETLIKLEDHKAKQTHDEEKHKVGMEIATQAKDLVTKFGNALAHMAEEK